MITNFFIPELNNHGVQELWFQQDGATCHTARATIDLLEDTLGDRLISRFGPVNWPPRSCDLTPLDYFLLKWPGHLIRLDDNQVTKKIFGTILYGSRKRGRLRWIDCLEQGWRTSGTRAIDGTRRNIFGTPMMKMVFFCSHCGHCNLVVMLGWKMNGDCKTKLAAGTVVEIEAGASLFTDPNSDERGGGQERRERGRTEKERGRVGVRDWSGKRMNAGGVENGI
ncbi:putative transposable element [Trichonephila clavipes]|nr:putative transposable element [Trichonephila clavipes]